MKLFLNGVPLLLEYSERKLGVILDSGYIDNVNYLIIDLGSHPTAYIGIPRLAKPNLRDIDLNVHGGITHEGSLNLSTNYLSKHNLKDIYWYGWDYAHNGDYVNLKLTKKTGRKWKFSEIFKHVLLAIKEFNKL